MLYTIYALYYIFYTILFDLMKEKVIKSILLLKYNYFHKRIYVYFNSLMVPFGRLKMRVLATNMPIMAYFLPVSLAINMPLLAI
jgi:hypothetical protein